MADAEVSDSTPPPRRTPTPPPPTPAPAPAAPPSADPTEELLAAAWKWVLFYYPGRRPETLTLEMDDGRTAQLPLPGLPPSSLLRGQ